MKLVKEIRDVSVRSGTQMLKCVATMLPDSKTLRDYQEAIVQGRGSGIYPVALGLTCALFNIPKRKAGLVLIYTFAVSMIGAALRLGIINHFEGQKTINELKPVMLNVVRKNVNKKLQDMWQFTPEIDTTQMLHEQSERKMFIS
jgi:urease accessory protein